MIHSEDFYALIRSLSRAEKKHFKLFASKHVVGEKNNSLKLFEAIEKQDVPDEDKIRRLFKGEKFIQHLPIVKNYLYNLILDSLQIYHQDLSPDLELKKMLGQVEVLYYKGLYNNCEDLLKKIEERATELEKFESASEVHVWRRRIMLNSAFAGSTERSVFLSFQTSDSIKRKIINRDEMDKLRVQLSFLTSTIGRCRSREQKEKYDSILKHFFLTGEGDATCFFSKEMFNWLHMTYHFYVTDNRRKVFEYAQRRLQVFENDPERISQAPDRYISALQDFLVPCQQLKMYSTIRNGIEKMRKLDVLLGSGINPMLRTRLFHLSYGTELGLYVDLGDFHKISEVASNIEQGIEEYRDRINNRALFLLCYNVAYLYFGIGEYKKAVHWLNKILNSTQDIREEYVCVSKILNLIIYYEQEDILLPHVVVSTYRYLIKRNRKYRSESVLIDYLRKLSTLLSREKEVVLFKKMRSELLVFVRDPFEKALFEYFDIISWLDSKIEKRSFAEIVKEKVQKK